MIISIDAEKDFDKIQHPFMIKTLQKTGIEGTYLNIIKAIYYQQHYPQWQNMESISCKVRDKTRVLTLTTTIQHSFGVLTIAIREEKEIKGMQIGKEVNSHYLQMASSST